MTGVSDTPGVSISPNEIYVVTLERRPLDEPFTVSDVMSERGRATGTLRTS